MQYSMDPCLWRKHRALLHMYDNLHVNTEGLKASSIKLDPMHNYKPVNVAYYVIV